jgi:WhiB family redox-sensing transcriptional regulator
MTAALVAAWREERMANNEFGGNAHSLGATPSTPGVVGSGVPDDWFVDPVSLGVPGVRKQTNDDEAGADAVLAWQSDSLCAQTDPEAFFPEKGGSTRDAKKICASCEVKSQCLEYALQNDERFGIWGGLSERERRKLRKRA